MKHIHILAFLLVAMTVINLTVRAEESATSDVVKEELALDDADPQYFVWMDTASVLLVVFGVGLIGSMILGSFALKKRLSQEEFDALKQLPLKKRAQAFKQHAPRWYTLRVICAGGLIITAVAFPILELVDAMRFFSNV